MVKVTIYILIYIYINIYIAYMDPMGLSIIRATYGHLQDSTVVFRLSKVISMGKELLDALPHGRFQLMDVDGGSEKTIGFKTKNGHPRLG